MDRGDYMNNDCMGSCMAYCSHACESEAPHGNKADLLKIKMGDTVWTYSESYPPSSNRPICDVFPVVVESVQDDGVFTNSRRFDYVYAENIYPTRGDCILALVNAGRYVAYKQ